ncbi:MAG: hypothetical protein ABW277_19615 [Longimicrobiaceae bacterium]
MLDELSGPPGFALWQAFRDVQLWSLASPKERSQLFAPGAAAARSVSLSDAELRAPLGVLLEMVERPTSIQEEVVAEACAAIARWAEPRGATATALAFAEAAATTCPENAALAQGAGRLARRGAEYGRAESWYLRAAGLGRRSGDWGSYAMGWVGMGRIQLQRGSLPRARRHFLRALRTARRHGLSDAEGRALHFLCVLDTESGDLESAEIWGKEVYRVLGSEHIDLPRVAHDLAQIWSLQGFCIRAQAVFRALLPHFTQPTDRLYVLSNMVRTAGRAGDRETFQEAWGAAWKLVGDPAAVDGCAFALLDMARGAVFIGERELAVQAAKRCIEAASSREEAKAGLEAEALLASLRSVQQSEEATAVVEASFQDETGDALAAEIIQGLNATTAP